MLTYSFTNLKNESLYMHLYQCIRQDIVDGKLVSGEKLPSKRSFAKNLGVSTITIENAYAQLLSEGYIYSIPKKGFYVSDFKNNVIKPVKLTTENVKLSSGQSDFLADFSSNQQKYSQAVMFWYDILCKTIYGKEKIKDNRVRTFEKRLRTFDREVEPKKLHLCMRIRQKAVYSPEGITRKEAEAAVHFLKKECEKLK